MEDSEEAWFASEVSLNAAIGNQSTTRPPRILPDHLLKFTKRELIGRALASAFLGLVGWAFLNVGLPGYNLSPLLVWTCINIVFAIFRNLILTKLYCGVRVGLGVHYKLRSGVAFASSLFGGFAGLMIGAVWFSSIPADPKITATILGIGFLTVATGFPIPPILSDRGEASLLFAQSAFEVKVRKDLTQGLRWSDRGVYVLRRVLKQYDMLIHPPTLRLGTKLYCLEKKEAKILDYVSQAILRLEEPDQFLVLREALQTLEAVGREAISRDITPSPRLEDYLDYKYLSLENVYRIVLIIGGVLMILYYCCWILRLPPCSKEPITQALSVLTSNGFILGLFRSSTILCERPSNEHRNENHRRSRC